MPWLLAQTVENLLALHHPCPADRVARHLPDGIEPELFDGRAWVSVMAMQLTDVHPRWLPGVPGLSRYPQVTVRTFVRCHSLSAVWFFSLDTSSAVAAGLGRRAFGLPYHRASISFRAGDDRCDATSVRRRDVASPPSTFQASWAGCGPPIPAVPGSLDQFLGERDWMVCSAGRGWARVSRVEHPHVEFQEADHDVRLSTMLAGLQLHPAGVTARYCGRLPSLAWLPRRRGQA